MNHPEQIRERLWNYIDGLGTAAEKSAVENLISTNLAWQAAYAELLELHQWIASQTLEAPSMRFSKNVMEQIASFHVAPATRSYLNKKIIGGLAGFFVVVILGLIIYAMTQVSWASTRGGGDVYGVGQLIKKIDGNKYFGSSYTYAFMMIAVVLGLMLLDMVLRPRTKPADQQSC
jgi:hypothetical protein